MCPNYSTICNCKHHSNSSYNNSDNNNSLCSTTTNSNSYNRYYNSKYYLSNTSRSIRISLHHYDGRSTVPR